MFFTLRKIVLLRTVQVLWKKIFKMFIYFTVLFIKEMQREQEPFSK